MPRDYYSTKKLIRNLGLPFEKIDACKNNCMLYWKDGIGSEYYKFCGARYKPTREGNPCHKKFPYTILTYLMLTPHLQRSYASRATMEHMMCHAIHQTKEGSMCYPSYAEAWRNFHQTYPKFAKK
ncbi:hypothetical protein Sango_2758600 [Sesamum angolense]|uniref:Uncharacterized protein n=1 Tax=Sesamum angolense TaxID=2727404 RepID=A0AAE1VXN0_9LAMI|nr:hypothetical protein Sango_2758600 [Sesamum angolense]